MATITDAEDVVLEATAEFEIWRAEFERRWYAPLGETIARVLLSGLPPEAQASLAATNPAAWAKFQEMMRLAP